MLKCENESDGSVESMNGKVLVNRHSVGSTLQLRLVLQICLMRDVSFLIPVRPLYSLSTKLSCIIFIT